MSDHIDMKTQRQLHHAWGGVRKGFHQRRWKNSGKPEM